MTRTPTDANLKQLLSACWQAGRLHEAVAALDPGTAEWLTHCWSLLGRPSQKPPEFAQGGGDWTFWLQNYPLAMAVLGGVLVVLTGLYAWATVAFGIRFSNLTHRGVLTNGPYAWTRHPAYVSKNLFWWFTALPFVVTNGSWTDALRNTVLLGVVSAIYYWRARTEEAHLLAEDPKYREYYDWMGKHGQITAPLVKLSKALKRRPPQAFQPAE